MNIESEENIMETLDLKVLGFENDEYASVNGTCYQGVIKTTYDQLVEIFGKPTYTEENDPYEKVNAEWIINQRLSSKMMMMKIISTNHLLFTTGKLVTFLLKSMSGISVVMILRRKRLQTQSLRTT